MPSSLVRSRRGLLLLPWLVACAPPPESLAPTGISKAEARELDRAQWKTDYCASESWYSDGVCDEFCPSPDPLCDPALEKRAQAFVEGYVAGYAPVEKELVEADWKAAATGTDVDYQAYVTAQIKAFTFHLDKKRYEELKPLHAERHKLALWTRRALETVEPNYLALELSAERLPSLLKIVNLRNEVLAAFNNQRPTLDGKEYSRYELRDLLKTETSGVRRKPIWEALKQLGPTIAPKILEAVRLANEVGASVGKNNFWEYSLRLAEIEPTVLSALFDELDRQTAVPYADVKRQVDQQVAARFGITPAEVMIWHYDTEFFSDPPATPETDLGRFLLGRSAEQTVEIAASSYRKLGLDVDDVVQRSDLYPRAGKFPNAFATSLDRQQDIRVMASVVGGDYYWMLTMLHELGHAAHQKGLDPRLPFLMRIFPHSFVTEGVAMFLESQGQTSEFLVEQLGADRASVEQASRAVSEHSRWQELVFARYCLVMFHFERSLYENPKQDLNTLWWDLVEKYQLVKRPPGRNQPDWSTKTHLASNPVYYHSYMLGRLFVAQLRATLARKAGYTGPLLRFSILGRQPAVELLRQRVLRVGRNLTWAELVQYATGEPLAVKSFADQVRTPLP